MNFFFQTPVVEEILDSKEHESVPLKFEETMNLAFLRVPCSKPAQEGKCSSNWMVPAAVREHFLPVPLGLCVD